MKISDKTYSQIYYDENGQAGDRPALRLFERLAKRHIGSGTVLDFGCGTGALLRRLRRTFGVVGVEASEWARMEACRSGLDVRASTKEIESGTLSGIVSIHVVEHIEDGALAELLSEWRRVLATSGKAIVITPDADGFASRRKGRRWIAYSDPTHINLKGHDAWRKLFEDAGFGVTRSGADGLWDFPYRWSWLGKLEVLVLGWPTLAQFVLGRVILKPGTGESSIFILERR